MTANDTLNMVRLNLEMRSLFELAKRRKLPVNNLDTGYAAHCYLKELFGPHAPAPFAMFPSSTDKFLTILGYTAADSGQMEHHARAIADPTVYNGCRWPVATKPLPSIWPVGARYGFEVRACPVVRKRSAGTFHKIGTEVDVFISRCWDVGDREVPVSREEIYCQWFADQVERIGGARLGNTAVKAFERQRMLRRKHTANGGHGMLERPSVLFAGTIEVTDPEGFAHLMRRGIGRHRAFGFGMLLLRSGA